MATTSTTIRVKVKDEASAGLKGIGANVAKFGQGLNSLVFPAGVTAGLLAGAAAIKQMVGALDDLDEAAQNAGISAMALADLRAGAREGGVGAEELDKALAKLNSRLADAREGGEDSQRIFKALGLDFKDSSTTAETAITALAKAFAGWKDGAEKVAFAQETLGEKLGPKFIAYLNQNADGLKRVSGVTPELVEQSAKLQTEIDKLAVAWERLKNAVAGAVVPAINNLINLGDSAQNAVNLTQQLNAEVANLKRLTEQRNQGGLLGALFVSEDDIRQSAARIFDLKFALQELNKVAPAGDEKGTAPYVGADKKPKGKTPAFDDSFLKAAEAIDAQIRALQEQSAVEKVLTDIEQGRIKVVSEGERQYLLQLAAGLDARKERIDAAKEEARTIEAAMENAIRAQERLDSLTGRAAANRQGQDQALLDDAFFSGKIGASEYDAGLRNVFGLVDGTNAALKEQKSLVEEIGLTFTSAFEDAIGSGNGLRGVIKGLGQDLLRLVTRKLVTEPLGNALTGLLKGISLGGLFGGARAMGGPVDTGSAYLVGERGPELFVPQSAGTIVPNGAAGGVSVVINQSIDSRSDVATIRAAGAMAVAEAERRILASMQRRGAFA